MNRKCVVVDTSIAIKWAIKEDDSKPALALLNGWRDRGIVILAPALLAYEATNVLYQQVRKGKLPLTDARRALTEIIFDLVEFDFPENSDFNVRAMELGQQFGLPAAYDSHFLALAESKECELWTADTRLWMSTRGKLAWLHWLGDYPAS